jgi:hypothetical protein
MRQKLTKEHLKKVKIFGSTTAAPFSFAQWLERPFPSFTSFYRRKKIKNRQNLRFFRLNEQQMQNALEERLKRGVRPQPQGKIPKQGRLKRRKQISKQQALQRLALEQEFPIIFRKCQEGDEELMDALGKQTVWFCEHILLLAENGNQAAFGYLAELAIKATRGIEKDYHEKPVVVPTHITSLEYAWPLMTSPATTLSSRPPKWKKLKLGTALGIKLDENRKLRLNTPSGRLAWKLYTYVANLRQAAKQKFKSKTAISSQGQRTIEQEAACLKFMNADSTVIESWWKVAESALIHSFHPTDNKEVVDQSHAVFAGIVRSEKDLATVKRHRSRILERLREQFYSIAKFPRHKGKKPPVSPKG